MHRKVSFGNLKTSKYHFWIEWCPPAQLGMLLTQHWLARLHMSCQAQA